MPHPRSEDETLLSFANVGSGTGQKVLGWQISELFLLADRGAPPIWIPVGDVLEEIIALTSGDVDLDGWEDVLILGPSELHLVSLRENMNSAKRIPKPPEMALGSLIRLADIAGDQTPELAYTTSSSGSLAFAAWSGTEFLPLTSLDTKAEAMAVCDLSNDGRNDLALRLQGSVAIVESGINPIQVNILTNQVPSEHLDFGCRDLDRNGLFELIVLAPSTITVIQPDSLMITKSDIGVALEPPVLFGDANGDDVDDVFMLDSTAGCIKVGLASASPEGVNFDAPHCLGLEMPDLAFVAANPSFPFALGDMNFDGLSDVLVNGSEIRQSFGELSIGPLRNIALVSCHSTG